MKLAADESIGLYYPTKQEEVSKGDADRENVDSAMQEYLIQKQRTIYRSQKSEKSLDVITEAERS